MRWLWGILAVVTLMCAAPAAAEQSAYNDAIHDRVQAMIDRHAFSEFEALADSYRMTNSHSPSGSMDLAGFHKWLQYSVLQLDNCENCAGKADAFVEAWLRARPHDKIAHITYANVLLAHAGNLRGEGFASTVPAEAWPKIMAFVDGARIDLMTVKAYASVDPEWYATLVESALLSRLSPGWIERYFHEGIKKYPDYTRTYYNMSNYLLPQWYGSWQQIDQMASKAAAGSTADSISLYFRIYDYIGEGCTCTRPMRESTAMDWTMMKRSMRATTSLHPTSWNFLRAAKMACDDHDFIEAQYYFRELRRLQNVPGRSIDDDPGCPVERGTFTPA